MWFLGFALLFFVALERVDGLPLSGGRSDVVRALLPGEAQARREGPSRRDGNHELLLDAFPPVSGSGSAIELTGGWSATRSMHVLSVVAPQQGVAVDDWLVA